MTVITVKVTVDENKPPRYSRAGVSEGELTRRIEERREALLAEVKASPQKANRAHLAKVLGVAPQTITTDVAALKTAGKLKRSGMLYALPGTEPKSPTELRRAAVIRLVSESPGVLRCREISERLGHSKPTIEGDLRLFRRLGMVRYVGPSKAGGYVTTDIIEA